MQARKEAIEKRLQQIRASSPGDLIRQQWEEHHGVMCAGVYWDRYSEAPLLHAWLHAGRSQFCQAEMQTYSADVSSREVHLVGTKGHTWQFVLCRLGHAVRDCRVHRWTQPGVCLPAACRGSCRLVRSATRPQPFWQD